MAKLQPVKSEYLSAENILLAGYEIPRHLLGDLSEVKLNVPESNKLLWVEFTQTAQLSQPRKEIYESLASSKKQLTFTADNKFWQATELRVPKDAIRFTKEWLNDEY